MESKGDKRREPYSTDGYNPYQIGAISKRRWASMQWRKQSDCKSDVE